MCDQHTHAKVETWITPENSRHLSAKMIGLFPGEAIPDHTTGPEREEVIVCIYGTVEVAFDDRIETVTSGNAAFIPENTHHAVLNNSDAPAQYAYVATKKQKVCPVCDGSGIISRSTKIGPAITVSCPHCSAIEGGQSAV